MNHCLIIKERERGREAVTEKWVVRAEEKLFWRRAGKKWNKAGMNGEKESEKKFCQRDSNILYGWEDEVSCIIRHNRGSEKTERRHSERERGEKE